MTLIEILNLTDVSLKVARKDWADGCYWYIDRRYCKIYHYQDYHQKFMPSELDINILIADDWEIVDPKAKINKEHSDDILY